MKIYIAGPMKGKPNENRKAFSDAKAYMLANNNTGPKLEVINPHDLTMNLDTHYMGEDEAYQTCMRIDIKCLVTCDAIYMLKGWEHSKGARLEHEIAKAIGLCICYQSIAKEDLK
jgi:hypothetical protein